MGRTRSTGFSFASKAAKRTRDRAVPPSAPLCAPVGHQSHGSSCSCPGLRRGRGDFVCPRAQESKQEVGTRGECRGDSRVEGGVRNIPATPRVVPLGVAMPLQSV